MGLISYLTGGLLHKGGRAEQITLDCPGLSFSEHNAALKKARELDEMMKHANIRELFAARVDVANRMSRAAPPQIQDWVQKMIHCMDQEIVLRAEYELSPQRREIIRESAKNMKPEDKAYALAWTKSKRAIVQGLDPNIDKELAEDERVLGAA